MQRAAFATIILMKLQLLFKIIRIVLGEGTAKYVDEHEEINEFYSRRLSSMPDKTEDPISLRNHTFTMDLIMVTSQHTLTLIVLIGSIYVMGKRLESG
jgi:hypothetical protein